MLLLTELTHASEERMEALAVIRPDNPFLLPDGRLERCVYPELIAQCFGACSKSLHPEATAPGNGYLVGLRAVHVYQDAHQGDTLRISVAPARKMDAMIIAQGDIFWNEERVADGQVKIYLFFSPPA